MQFATQIYRNSNNTRKYRYIPTREDNDRIANVLVAEGTNLQT